MVDAAPTRKQPGQEPGPQPTQPPTAGPRPEVDSERTNFGPVVDEVVAALRRNQRRYGVDAGYDLVRERFDHYHYLFQAPELRDRRDADPIRVFLRAGAEAKTSPEPHFSMSKYLARYPHRKDGPERSPYLAWLRHGRASGENADPADGIEAMSVLLGLEPNQIVDEVVRIRTDVMARLRSGVLGEMFAKAVEVEPLIGEAWPETVTGLNQLPLRNESVARAVAGIHACHETLGFRGARVVIVTERSATSGRELARHLAGAFAPEDIVVIYTRPGGGATGGLPAGVREIDLASQLTRVGPGLQEQTLVVLLRSLAADAVVNCDSELFYRALVPFGRALAVSDRIFLYFSSNEQQPLGNWDGPALRWTYPALDYVAGIITDGEYLRDAIAEQYQLSDAMRELIFVFCTPPKAELPVTTPRARTRPSVFWVGRRGRRWRLDLLRKIAQRMPDVDFHLWLYETAQDGAIGNLPPNVKHEGAYREFTDLDLAEADAWLYTAAWDGVPELLLDVAMSGVPIVASNVGGVSEVLTEAYAWPIAASDGPDAYTAALREVLADPPAARQRSLALRERLIAERTKPAYAQVAVRALLKPDATPDEHRAFVP